MYYSCRGDRLLNTWVPGCRRDLNIEVNPAKREHYAHLLQGVISVTVTLCEANLARRLGTRDYHENRV